MGQYEKKRKSNFGMMLRTVFTFVLSLVCLASVTVMLAWGSVNVGIPSHTTQASGGKYDIMDRYDMQMTNQISSALEGILAIDKVYWLKDEDLIAPEPDQEKYGTASNAAEMADFLLASQDLLDGQATLFTTETPVQSGTQVTYYLDETIMVISWRQLIHGCVYTISEVKIAHPSQFRRFLADGIYGSNRQYSTTRMAATVNAVTASSGDFYKFRDEGIMVYNGEVMRHNKSLDVCYITEDADMIFTRSGELATEEEAKAFVEENKVRFSLAFGPVLVDNHEKIITKGYPIGEVNQEYSRAALAQMDELHFLLIAANHGGEGGVPTMMQFADTLVDFGVEKAYALDGGQTAVVVTNDQLMNRPDWGTQRMISDIIYFATAVPDGGK